MKMFEFLPEPHMTLFLDIDAETAARRKSRYTAFETGLVDNNSQKEFIQTQSSALQTIRKLSVARNWTRVDASRPPDEIVERVLSHDAVLDFLTEIR